MMHGYLRQSSASQTRMLGPFIDDTDFKTPATGLTIANTDVKLNKNGAASANKNSGGGTHSVNGMYAFTFDATDTNTVGELAISINVAGALVVVAKFYIVAQAIFDGLFASTSARVPADMTAISGDTTAADNLETAADGGSFNLGGGGVVAASVTGAVGSIAANGVSASSLAADAGAEIADAVLDEVVEGTTTLRQSMRLANSANAGKATGMGTATARLRDLADSKDRVVATVDSDGNRSSVTTDVT